MPQFTKPSRLLGSLLLLTSCLTLLAVEPVSPQIASTLHRFIDAEEISGAVTLVARGDAILHFHAQGMADLAAERPMRHDDLFWIASMTKPIVGVAIMILQEEGRLSVEDPVERHLAEFKNLWLVDEPSSERTQLKRPHRPITLRDLLTHTSGVPNVNEPRAHSTLGELTAMISQQALQFEPGSQWSYSNAGINTLGHIVEVLSGQTLDTFLEQRIFKPLGMRHTTFFPTKRQQKRLAKPYEKTKTAGLQETSYYFIKGAMEDRQRTVKASGGLFSTAEDMYRFYRMMLNEGVYQGHRILSASSVHAMTRTQTGDIETGFSQGMSWGFGFQVVKHPQGVTAMLAPGTFGHGGAYATQSWADPQQDLIYILMIQRRGFPNGDQSSVRQAFQEAAAEEFSQ